MKNTYNLYSSIILGFILVLLSACSDEYDFKFEDQMPLLVVDGYVNNQDGPYFVRLSESIKEVINPNTSGSAQSVSKPIANAEVILSDDEGNSETLRYIGEKPNTYLQEEGWYIVENITGVVGRTYTLNIVWEGRSYAATDKMEAVPSIERIGFRTKHLEAKNEDVDIPLIYFNEPQDEKNYYLLYFSSNGYLGSNRNWAFSILNDDYLDAYVNGLEIDDGQSPSGRDFYSYIGEGTEVDVYLESLSAPAYEFYRGIINQFNADGGAFSPNPASPTTNVSGRAQGFFRASAVSVKSITR